MAGLRDALGLLQGLFKGCALGEALGNVEGCTLGVVEGGVKCGAEGCMRLYFC